MIDETFIRHTFFNILISTDANVHKAHTYELHTDERRTHTNVSEFYSGPIRKYMPVDVRGSSSMCEGGFYDR